MSQKQVMHTRSIKSIATFPCRFKLSGHTQDLPAGDYDVLVEEELIQGLSFPAYRRTGTYLLVRGSGPAASGMELRPISEADLRNAIVARQRTDPARP